MEVRIKCANCSQIMNCDESILDIRHPACPECQTPIVIEAYAPLRKMKEDREAARLAEKQRKTAEHEARLRAQKEAREAQEREKAIERMKLESELTLPPIAKPKAAESGVPNYEGLKAVSSLFGIAAIIYYVLAAVALIVGLIILARASESSSVGSAIFALQPIGSAIILFIVAVFCHGCEHACTALRDIAINSFRK